jgi:Tfp pilus assembly protein PilF
MATPDSTFSSKEGRIQFCQDCLEKGYLDLAIRELMKGLNLFPDDPDIYFFMGVAYDSRNMRERAVEYYQHCLELAPDHGEAHCNLGADYHWTTRRRNMRRPCATARNFPKPITISA